MLILCALNQEMAIATKPAVLCSLVLHVQTPALRSERVFIMPAIKPKA